MSIRHFLLFPVFVLFLALLPQSVECKTIYRYKDASGNICFTDNLKSIPAKFRKEALPFSPSAEGVTNTAPIPADPPSATPPAEPVAPPSAAAGAIAMASDYWQMPLVRGGAILAGAFVVFLFLLKLLEHIPSQNLGRLILLVYFLGTSVFVYKLCVEKMLQGYAAAKVETTRVVDEVNSREKTRHGGALQE